MSTVNITLEQRQVFEAFEDLAVEGESVEVKAVANVLKLVPGDILVVEVEVGKMPYERVKDHLVMVKRHVEDIVPTGTKVVVIEMREGTPSVNFKALRFAKVDER